METNKTAPTQTTAAEAAALIPELPPVATIPPAPRSMNEQIKLIGIALGGILIGILLFMAFQYLRPQKKIAVAPTPTPTMTPTPTPLRAYSVVATSSAFTQLEQHITAVSGALENFTTDDPSLTPPSFVLPLGFSN